MIESRPSLAGDRRWCCLLLLAALLLYCLDLGSLPLRDWDEGTVAQVAREISQSEGWRGWLQPQLWGQPYFNKPPFVHDLIALAYRFWGVHTWTARLPGALLSAIAVPGLYCLGRAVFATRPPALLGAWVYLTLLPVVRHGRLAMLDGAITCFFIWTLWMLLAARRNTLWYLGAGIGLMLMCLTKGILGILLMAIALLFLLWDRPQQLLSTQLWGGLILGMAPVLLWYGWQWQTYGQPFVNTMLLSQSADRIWRSVEDNGGPPWYYLLEILKYGWPWLLFWPTGIGLTGRSRYHTWAKLILVWTVGYLGVISLMSTKLPWYVFPLYPAIALTVGVALAAAWDQHRHWNGRSLALRRFPFYWWPLLGLMSAIGLAGVIYSAPGVGIQSPWLMMTAMCLLVTTGIAAVTVRQQQSRFVPILVGGFYGALLCFVVSDEWVWELNEDFPVVPVAAMIQEATPSTTLIYSDQPYERPSLSFYSDRRVLSLSPPQLMETWQQQQPAYLLVQNPQPYQTTTQPFTELGRSGDRYLITNQSQ